MTSLWTFGRSFRPSYLHNQGCNNSRGMISVNGGVSLSYFPDLNNIWFWHQTCYGKEFSPHNLFIWVTNLIVTLNFPHQFLFVSYWVSSPPSVVPHFRSEGGVSLHCQSRVTLRLDLVGTATQSDGKAAITHAIILRNQRDCACVGVAWRRVTDRMERSLGDRRFGFYWSLWPKENIYTMCAKM